MRPSRAAELDRRGQLPKSLRELLGLRRSALDAFRSSLWEIRSALAVARNALVSIGSALVSMRWALDALRMLLDALRTLLDPIRSPLVAVRSARVPMCDVLEESGCVLDMVRRARMGGGSLLEVGGGLLDELGTLRVAVVSTRNAVGRSAIPVVRSNHATSGKELDTHRLRLGIGGGGLTPR